MQISAQVHVAEGRSVVGRLIEHLECMQDAEVVSSCVAGVEEVGSLELGSINDPHKLEAPDVFVAEGKINVAENPAMWVDDENIYQRVGALSYLVPRIGHRKW